MGYYSKGEDSDDWATLNRASLLLVSFCLFPSAVFVPVMFKKKKIRVNLILVLYTLAIVFLMVALVTAIGWIILVDEKKDKITKFVILQLITFLQIFCACCIFKEEWKIREEIQKIGRPEYIIFGNQIRRVRNSYSYNADTPEKCVKKI